MRAKPSSNSRAGKPSRANGKSHSSGSKSGNKNKHVDKKDMPDLSVLRQPVDTSVSGLKQAVKVFETGTSEVVHLLTYDCDVVYECKICRNLFRSLANFISHKRVYCTQRYSRSQDLQRSNTQGEHSTMIIGERLPEKLPTRITARKDLTSIVEALGGQNSHPVVNGHGGESRETTVHLEPIDNTSYGVFQTVLNKPDRQDLMRNQVAELQNLLSKNEVVLGPDGRVLQNGLSDLHNEDAELNEENDLVCSVCDTTFANRKTLAKHKRLFHESIRTSYSCPCCKNYFANPWSVYRHLYKVHRKTNEQVRRLRSQIHKKDIRVEKTVVSSPSKKVVTSISKRKAEFDQRQKVLRNNKEWINHFEDDLRCGGCARKFERKAALIAHSQICQKRIAACNRVQHAGSTEAQNPNIMSAVVALTPLPCSKKPMPKPSPEKKIGIQVRMNYCKSGSPSQSHSRQLRSVEGEESDIDGTSVDGKVSIFHHPIKNSVDLKESTVLEQFFKNASKCGTPEGIEKVSSYLTNTLDKVGRYEISTCKRSTVLRSNVGKNKSLEAKCLQLRSALENGVTDQLKGEGKDRELENSVYLDGNIDNTSESNTSAISSLSSQLTPLVDKTYVEVEQSIEIKNINISRSLDSPGTEADSTSMSNGGGLHMTYNSRTYTGNIKFSPTGEATCEEVSTSVISDEIPQLDPNLNVDSSCIHDDEVSISLKPITLEDEFKNWSSGREFENTISILTRNKLKTICKDDVVPQKDDKRESLTNGTKKSERDTVVDTLTKEIMQKKFHKYADWNKNECRLCNQKFKSSKNIYSHIHTHTHWKRYECLFNGCTFKTFFKRTLLSHVAHHSKEIGGRSLDSLVGVIDKSKWNLKLIKPPKTVSRPKTVLKVISLSQQKHAASKKLAKTVNRLTKKSVVKPVKSEKVKIKSKSLQNGLKKIKATAVLKNNSSRQKLLTDFKSFSGITGLNKKTVSLKNNKLEAAKASKRKKPETSLESSKLKKKKANITQNGVHSEETFSTQKAVSKKPRAASNSPDQSKINVAVVKREVKEDEIMVNHIRLTQESNDASVTKGRVSRSSSRKSSVNSVEHQKAKSLVHSVIKNEDSNTLYTTVIYESPSPTHHNAQIIDSPSLEEEESQESDRPVDDSHLKKIVMEVIFGGTPSISSPVSSPGRPVRNKSRPKRDRDFILGSPKDSDREITEVKTSLNKKSAAKFTVSKSSSEGSLGSRKRK